MRGRQQQQQQPAALGFSTVEPYDREEFKSRGMSYTNVAGVRMLRPEKGYCDRRVPMRSRVVSRWDVKGKTTV